MPDFVRVKDPISGGEFTTSAAQAKSAKLTVIDKDAVDQLGNPLPGKPNRGPAPGSVAKKKSATSGNDSGPENAATEEDS